MKKIIVIYHRADFDGIFCREIAKKFLGDTAEYIGWHYGDAEPSIPPDIEQIYMLDISIDGWLMNDPRLIWIDHHKSAIDKYDGPDDAEANLKTTPRIKGYRIDGVAACRLAWWWFSCFANDGTTGGKLLYGKQTFVARQIPGEPLAVQLAGEYDIWDKRDPRAELFQHGLRSQELKDLTWRLLLIDDGSADEVVESLLHQGEAIQYAQTELNKDIITSYGFDLEFEGLKFLACNHARYNSHLFTAGLRPDHDACFGFKWTGKFWEVSLYHAPGKEHHDLSLIAVKHGGGGHPGACGFRMDTIPFLK